MKGRRIIGIALILTIVSVMVLSLVGCGPSKDPADVKALLKKAIEKKSFTLEMYDSEEGDTKGDIVVSFKFAKDRAEIFMFDTTTTIVFGEDKATIYEKDAKGNFSKTEEPLTEDANLDSIMDEALAEFDNVSFTYVEEIGGFVPTEDADNPDNTAYGVLDKGVFSIYDDGVLQGVLKDVGKTKVNIPKVD